jgi:hypothetical protein
MQLISDPYLPPKDKKYKNTEIRDLKFKNLSAILSHSGEVDMSAH